MAEKIERPAKEQEQDYPDGNPLDGLSIGLRHALTEANDEDTSYLGDPDVLRSMIGVVVSDAMLHRLPENRTEGEDQEQWLHDRIAKEVAILLGRGNDYRPVSAAWNAPDGGIVDFVRARYRLSDRNPESIIAYPFYAVLEAALAAEALDEQGEDWEHLLGGEIASAVNAFMGIDDSRVEDA